MQGWVRIGNFVKKCENHCTLLYSRSRSNNVCFVCVRFEANLNPRLGGSHDTVLYMVLTATHVDRPVKYCLPVPLKDLLTYTTVNNC